MRKRLLYKNLFVKIQLLLVLLLLTTMSVYAQTFNLTGSAKLTTANHNFITLTERVADQNGAAWSTNKIDLRYNFNLKFVLNFGTGSTGGADGMTFTLQGANNTISGSPFGGSYLGIYGISPALSVEYDALGGGPPFNDLSQAHLGLDKNGDATSSGKLIAEVPAFDNGTSVMFDGNNHTSRVVWNATTKKLFVYFDEVLKITYSADIVATIFGSNPAVYFGFTGATGGYTEIQTVTYDPTSTFAIENVPPVGVTPLSALFSVQNTSCNGGADGKIQAIPSGGTAPFTYTISGRAPVTNQTGNYEFTGLVAGAYTVGVTDIFGDSYVTLKQITEPSLPVITSSTGSNVLCANTSLDLKVSAAGNSVLFNNGYAEAPSTSAIQLTSQITLEAWVKLSDVSGFQYIVSKGNYDAAGDGQYGLALKDGRFNAHMSKANFAPGNAHVELIATNLVVQPNVWYHVASTWDGITYKIYINGNLENSMLATFTMTPTNEPLEIGRLGQPNGYLGYSYHYPIKGQIDELRIWNTAKTSTEINANKNQKVLATSPNLVAYYSFDEGTGTTLSDAVNGNTATFYALNAPNDVSGVLVGNLPVWQNSTAPINYASYQWLSPGSGNSPTLNVTAAGAYSAIVTSVNGCTNTTQVSNVSIINNAETISVAQLFGSTTVCEGSSVLLTGPVFGFGGGGGATPTRQWQLNGVDIAGANGLTYAAAVTGSYTLVSSSAEGCPGVSNAINITILPAPATPTITSSTGKFDFCAGSSINLISSSNTNNLWSNGLTSNQITVNASGNYTVTLTGSNGCTATSTSITTSAVPLPSVGISVSNYKAQFCEGETALYYVPQPNADLTYVWTRNVSFTFGDEVPVGTGPTYSATATGWYTATATNSTGCSWSSGMIKVEFVAATKPVISTSTGKTDFCAEQGGSVSLISSGVSNTNIWSTGATTNNITINSVGTNNYTVSSLDANGCRATSDPITITGATIPAAPGISVTNNEFCPGSSVTFTVPNPDPSLTYQWLISVGGAFATDIPGATGTSYIASTADRFTVRAKNAGGCSILSGTIQLFQKSVPAPVMDLISTASCGGVNTTNGSIQFIGVVAPFVNWKNSLGTVISTNPFVPNLGAGTYTATAVDACGVQYTKSIDVVAPVPLNATFTNSTGSTTLCAGTSTNLVANTAYAYAWYRSVGGAAATYYSSANTIVVNTAGDYYVQLQDIYGCSYNSSATTITVLPAPTAALDISVTSTNNCIGNFTGSATAAFVPNTGSGTPTFSGWTGPNGFTSNSLSINNRPAGTYTATAVDFCGVTASKSVTILAPITQFVVSGGGAYCAGGAGVSINLSGSEIGVRYELIKDLINQGIFIDGTGGAIAFNNITAAGNYLIRSERTADACAIMASSSATVSVTAYPQVFTVTGGVTFCSSDIANFTFTLDGTTSGTNYAIHRNDGSTDVITNTFVGTGNSISFNLGAPTSNTTTYTITGTSATGGCTVAMNGAATFIRLASPAIPTITASGLTTFCPSSSVTLTSSALTNNVWMPGTISGNSISVNQTGSYTVTTTAANGCKATSAAITVTAQDNIAPVAVVGALPNLTIAVNGLVPSPTATDNCGTGVIIGTPSIPITNLAQGVYTIIWTYTDNSGNSSTQTQSVTVSAPATPPAFKTLVDIVKNNDLGICGATVNYTMPLANGDASTTKVNITEGGGDGIISFDIPLANKVSSLDFITTGEYKDIVHGHGENISVNVELFNPSSGLWTVVQTIQTGTGDYHFGGTSMSFPEITQVSKIRFTASQPVLAAFHFYEMNVNLNSIKIIQTGGLASGAVFPVGETVNTFTATDMFGNAAQASFKVTIIDAEKPTISNTSSTQKYADGTGAYTGSGGTISFNDNCANALSVKESYFNQQGVLFLEATTPVTQGSLVLAARRYPLGINTVMLTATDAAGNATVSKFNLTVLDTSKPIIVRPTNITRTADLGSCGASINVEPPVVSDNCSVASISVTSSNGGTGARGLYPVGTTTLTWKVKDGSGNESIATQTITVTDNQAPYINGVPNNIFRTNDAGTCGAVVTWAAVTASDNCSVVTVFTSDHISGETFPLGVTTVNYSARDQYNNVKTASFSITVTDNEAPSVRTKPWTVTLVNGSASISTANINNGTTDNCIGAITYSLSKSLFSCADVGTNLVTLTATDVSGNSSSATAIVTVVGQKLTSSITASATSAVFTGGVPTNLYVGYGPQTVNLSNIVVGSIGVTYAWSGVGISANTTGQSTVFTAPAAGLYTITCTATNSFGCTTTSTIAICVRDIRQSATANSPVFVCHTDMKTGANSTLTLAVSAVANQLSTNPQDKLGSCGMAPCTQTPTAIANVITADTIVVQSKISMPEKVAEKLTVKVSPNPSATSFTFIISSKNKQKVSVQIMDGAGRMMEANNNAPIEATFRMGEKLISGMYYAVFIQGQERVVVKLIKQDRF